MLETKLYIHNTTGDVGLATGDPAGLRVLFW